MRKNLVLVICFIFSGLQGVQLQAENDHTDVATSRSHPNASSLPKFELGTSYIYISKGCCEIPSSLVGVGASYNLTNHFAIEGNFAFTPETSTAATNVYGGRHAEYLLGLRAEMRAKHYGYFLKAQPGMTTWSNVITAVVHPPNAPTPFYFLYGNRRYFASNVAGGFEYSPSPRIHVRGEIGDLIEAYSRSSWMNHLQSTVGIYVGLGKSITWRPPEYKAKASHKFFDWKNSTLITASVLGMTADAITTQRFISRGQTEGNPIARPLVEQGWAGQVAAMGLELNAEVWGMYGLHRINQHWIERIVPAGVATTHAIYAYSNDTTTANPKP